MQMLTLWPEACEKSSRVRLKWKTFHPRPGCHEPTLSLTHVPEPSKTWILFNPIKLDSGLEGSGTCLYLPRFVIYGHYIYLIDRVRGPYWENIGPRSWQYGPSRFGEVRTRKTKGRYSPSTARANSVNKRFITRLLVSEKTRTANATSIQRAMIAKIKLIVFVGFPVQV